jgi:Tfp pilus assembly protein PilN
VASATLIVVAVCVAMVTTLVSEDAQGTASVSADIMSLQQRVGEQGSVFAAHQRRQAVFAQARRVHAARLRQTRLLASLPATRPHGLRLNELSYHPPTVELQGVAESALQVAQWQHLLEMRKDIANAELQQLQLAERQTLGARQSYRYRIKVELSAAGFDFMTDGAVQ